jgi:uncharacterized protein
MSPRLFKWIKIALILYGLIGIAVYYLQDQFLFHPQPKYKHEKINTNLPYREVNIPFNASSNIHLVQFTTDSTHPCKGVVLYFHGNRKNIDWYAAYAQQFTRNQYEVWMIDYPGFGKSTGKLTEQRLYDYAIQLYKLARTRYVPSQIVLYGKSMGTGIAAQLASIRDCQALILETPYYSIPDLLRQYLFMYPLSRMIHYRLPTYQYLPKVTAPITVFHGTRDGVIPYRHASKLKAFLKKDDQFYTLVNGTHNDLSTFLAFQKGIDSVLLEISSQR